LGADRFGSYSAERRAVYLERIATSSPNERRRREEAVVGVRLETLICTGLPVQLAQVIAVAERETDLSAPVDPRTTNKKRPAVFPC
jgi:hypothetical protein